MSRSINYGASPLLASKTPVWRSKLIVAGLALAFVVLGARAAYVQVFNSDFFQRQGEQRFVRTFELSANRGQVLDRNGLILASSVVAQSIWAIPEDVDSSDPNLSELARLIDLPLPELQRRLALEDRTFVWLRRQVDAPVAKQIAALGIAGIHQRREFKRHYPEGASAAHVVGFTNVEEQGQEGVELVFNEQLVGVNGSRRVIRDRLGRVVEDVRAVLPPQDGTDLRLSIDSRVQHFAFQKLRQTVQQHRAQAGSVVVLDTQSGEVLALVNYPSFDPNQRRNLSGAQLRNRALTDSFEPGSIVKPFMAALALEKGLARPETPIHMEGGRVSVGGISIRDRTPKDVLTLTEVMARSSNVGIVMLAMQMHPRDMWEMFTHIGLGRQPQLSFPGAVSGRVRPYKNWRPIEQATISYGYGLSTSLFQLAQAYTVFARGGELIPVSLLKTDGPVSGVRVFGQASANAVRDMLVLAAGPGGTGAHAQTMGYSVAGKTGTTRKQEGGAYAKDRHRSFFVGFAPAESPRIVVAVMIDEPSAGQFFGGVVAAPVFSETVQHTLRILGVQPDMTVLPQIVTDLVEESF
ncbi:penicillin-binding protein 2 [Hydrogenophaga sp.]|uniref:peptidoglycan D,D-transpeptidase FtsI family protein n=1 Tax=Hydrogenophaga sp. TaxID=1904254 RepID=UPI001992AAEB|nr:penicillin-binding protein 2 [Hydrogenophaga sp.]MBD3892647.1 penicillin-binding protein 2 [Hydrogenophaga sp.]